VSALDGGIGTGKRTRAVSSRMCGRFRQLPLLCLAGFGAVLFVVAFGHHAREISDTAGVTGPLVAFVLDGVPPVAIVYGGVRLGRSDLPDRDQWRVVRWCLGGGLLFGTAMGATFLVRLFEGRSVAEPIFPLLVAVEAGAIAGLLAGYYNAKARTDARQARTASDALAFVNDLLRHDVRNDLAVIDGRAELLREDREGPTPCDEHAAVISEKAGEALERIETTRAVADVLIGDPELESVDLAAIVRRVATGTRNAFDVTVETDLPERAPVVANAGLQSIVDNLLENAAEHNDADEPRIEVSIESVGEDVRLTVSDNGPGIPDGRKASPPDASGSGGGGLVLVRTLIEGYGGTIRIEDNEPRGSVFVVALPRAG